MAKVAAGVMIGPPPLAALGLLRVMARVRRRGRLGRSGGVTVRALLAPVLGVGGWLLAVVVDLATSIAVPIDDEALVLISVALPVAAGIYWAGSTAARRAAPG